MQNCNCKLFSVFGITCDNPNLRVLVHGGGVWGYDGTGSEDDPQDQILPDVNGNYTGQTTWAAGGAKVPAYYPYGCDTNPPVSSAELPDGDPQKWVAPGLVTTANKDLVESPDADPGTGYLQRYSHFGGIFASRTIYEDRKQTTVVYITSPDTASVPTDAALAGDLGPQFTTVYIHKDHKHVSIDDPSDVTHYKAEFRSDTISYPPDYTSVLSNMDLTWGSVGGYISFPGPDGTIVESWMPYDGVPYYPANCQSYGKRFYCYSTFIPNKGRRASDESKFYWQVGRLDYSDMSICHNSYNFLNSGNAHALGDYLLMLPSKRAHLLSDPPTPLEGTFDSLLPDEPWWTAVNADRTKLVTGRWLNSDLRDFDADPNTTTTDALYGFSDGTLKEDEVACVILDPASLPSEYPDSNFANIQVWSYTHINGVCIGVFTTDPDVTGAGPIQSITSDFGVDGSPTGTGDINHGLPSGLSWLSTAEVSGDGWRPDIDGYYSNPTDYTVIDETKVSLKANSSPSFIGQVSATIKVQWADSTALTFDYRLDNSLYGEDGRPTNFPATDPDGHHDELQLWINGVMVWSTDNTEEPAEFQTFYDWYGSAQRHSAPVSIDMKPGEKTIRFTLNRVTDNNKLAAWIDNVTMKIMVGDDPDGVNRWYFICDPAKPDRQKVWRAQNWKWPRRDDETVPTPALEDRATTIPFDIAYDWREDKLYIGNPHYIAVVRMDEGHEGTLDSRYNQGSGYLEWTASANIPAPTQVQNGDCDWVQVTRDGALDGQLDPPWGRFQIHVAKNCVQVRGANASWRDATNNPLPLNLFPNEQFAHLLNARYHWTQRAHAWSISHDGNIRVPHVQILWKPYRNIPAFPVSRPYTNTEGDGAGPWPSWMEADSEDIPDHLMSGTPNPWWFARIRDPRRVPFTSRVVGHNTETDEDIVVTGQWKPTWTDLNKIIPNTYCDSTNRLPQYKWLQNPNPDPTDPGDSGYPEPPWPSAQYLCALSYHVPHGFGIVQNDTLGGNLTNCPQYDADGIQVGVHYQLDSLSPSGSTIGPYDFDVVDDAECICNCLPPAENQNVSA